MRRLSLVGFSILLTIALVEIGLRIHPHGGWQYVNDLARVQSFVAPDENEYALLPGVHQLSHWTLTVDTNGNRWTPASAQGCVIDVIGDSVAMGWAVDDHETFTNLLAMEVPGQYRNRAVVGYNVSNLLHNVRNSRADVLIVLLVGNDTEVDDETTYLTWAEQSRPYSALIATAQLMQARRVRGTVLEVRSVDAINWQPFTDERVLLYTIDESLPGELLTYDHVVSGADPHPNAAGHEQLAAQMSNDLREACNG